VQVAVRHPHRISDLVYMRSTVCRSSTYHEAVGEDLDAGVAEGGGGELERAEVAREDLRGHGHEVVDHVDEHGGRRQAHQQAFE